MNFKTHAKPNEDFGKRVISSKKDMGDLEKKSLMEGSFEIDQSQKHYETVTGLDRFNPKAVDPNSLDRFNPKAVELDQDDNTSMPELPTFSPTLGFDIPNNPIEDEILEPFEQLGLNLEDLNANDLLDQNDFSNLDNFLDQMENLADLMQEIIAGGRHNQEAPTGGIDAAEQLGSLHDASVKIDGWTGDHDGDGVPNWRDGDWWFRDDEDPAKLDRIDPDDGYPPSGSGGTNQGDGDDDSDGDDTNGDIDLDQAPWNEMFKLETLEDDDDSQDGDHPGGIMATGNESELPPWIILLDDSTDLGDLNPIVFMLDQRVDEITGNNLERIKDTQPSQTNKINALVNEITFGFVNDEAGLYDFVNNSVADNKFTDELTNTNEELLAKGVATDLEYRLDFAEATFADQGTFELGGIAESALANPAFEASTIDNKSVMSQPMSINTMTPIAEI